MIYSKIQEKQELDDDSAKFPHLRDEIGCIQAVRRLSIDDCRRLFALIRRAGRQESRRRVTVFLTAAECLPED